MQKQNYTYEYCKTKTPKGFSSLEDYLRKKILYSANTIKHYSTDSIKWGSNAYWLYQWDSLKEQGMLVRIRANKQHLEENNKLAGNGILADALYFRIIDNNLLQSIIPIHAGTTKKITLYIKDAKENNNIRTHIIINRIISPDIIRYFEEMMVLKSLNVCYQPSDPEKNYSIDNLTSLMNTIYNTTLGKAEIILTLGYKEDKE